MFVPSLSKRLELNGMFYLLIFIVLSYNLINVNKVKSLKKLNFLIVVGIPFILLFMFMQISYIAEYTNIFVIVAPFLLLFFYDETISIKNVGKELFNSFS
jgi:phosphatidylserine synthase